MKDEKIAKAIILNLGDGTTTSLSYLLPMVLFGGRFEARSLLIGGTGGAVSMALNLDDSENGQGSHLQTVVAFVSAFAGGVLPVLPFIVLHGLSAEVTCFVVVALIVATLIWVKAQFVGIKLALKQTLGSLIPAMFIVGTLSLL